MRKSVAAFMLNKRRRNGRAEWLTQWNRNWQRYNFVGGHKREDESFRDCVVREISEELGLQDGVRIAVDIQYAAHLEYVAWSHSAQAETQYAIELFWSRLWTPEAEQIVESNPGNRWLTETEIREKQTTDGEAVSETVYRVLAGEKLLECEPRDDGPVAGPLVTETDSGPRVVGGTGTNSYQRQLSDNSSEFLEPNGEPIMNDELRHKTVAVAVLYDDTKQQFLLWNNPRWHGYAFPMKKFDTSADESPEQKALAACLEWNVPLPVSEDTPVESEGRMGDLHYSFGTRELTVYDYHLAGVQLSNVDTAALHPDLRFFSYEELQDASNVTESTKSITRWLVGDRHVVAAVISRQASRGREFLLTATRKNQYFFPVTRIRREADPTEELNYVVRDDLCYEGDFEVVDQAQVDAVQDSERFGSHQTQFHFYLYRLDLPQVNLNEYGNVFGQALGDAATEFSAKHSWSVQSSYWGWFTEEQMRTRNDMSPSMPLVLDAALRLGE